jgi:AcrR family transcriptional regulator
MARRPAPDVRTRILESALALLGAGGVAALTQPKVSRAAGVSQSHLTYYFPTRAELLLAVARHAIGRVMARLHEAVAQGGAARVERGAGVLAGALSDKRNIRVMLGLVVASDEDRKIKASLRRFVADVRGVLRAELRAMGAEPDEAAVAGLHAIAVGLAVLNLARDNAGSRRELEVILRRSIAGLVRRPPAKRGAGHASHR